MDIMKKVYKIIGSRLKRKRVQFNITQSDIGTFDLTFIDKNIISSIENGKLFKTRRTFITDEEMLIFQYFFRINKGHIIFGESNQEIEDLVFKLYKYAAYNMISTSKNEYCNDDIEIFQCGKALQEIFQFSPLYSCHQLYFGHLFFVDKHEEVLKKSTINMIYSFYNRLVLYFWGENKIKIVSSFIGFFRNAGDFNMKDFEYLLKSRWMNIHLKNLFNEIQIDYKQVPIYAVGYDISDDILNNVKEIIYYTSKRDSQKNKITQMRSKLQEKDYIQRQIDMIKVNAKFLIIESKNHENYLNIWEVENN